MQKLSDAQMEHPLLENGFIARGGQTFDPKLVPTPKQHDSRGEEEVVDQGTMPAHWKSDKRGQKDVGAT